MFLIRYFFNNIYNYRILIDLNINSFANLNRKPFKYTNYLFGLEIEFIFGILHNYNGFKEHAFLYTIYIIHKYNS